jgi:hypothetical protein
VLNLASNGLEADVGLRADLLGGVGDGGGHGGRVVVDGVGAGRVVGAGVAGKKQVKVVWRLPLALFRSRRRAARPLH